MSKLIQDRRRIYGLPRWRFTRWLTDAGMDVPHDIRVALIADLYGTVPIFVGGLINTVLVAGVIAAKLATPVFLWWFAFELALCCTRAVVYLAARRAASEGRPAPTDLYLSLSVVWGASVGYGALISMLSGDWVAATLACLSAAAMVGGICFRNFGAPRLAAVMIALSLGPCCIGAAFSGEPILAVVYAQIPLYLFAMTLAAFRLNGMLIKTMKAERENDRRARHDGLTGLANRSGLERAVARKLQAIDGIGRRLAVLYLDLDGFKAVNDTHGHASGDMLLKQVAERIREQLGPGDVAARIGGDEFIVVVEGEGPSDLTAFGEHLIRAVGSSYDLGSGAAATIGVSVGVALAPDNGVDLVALLVAADAALYDAKSRGKSRCSLAPPNLAGWRTPFGAPRPGPADRAA